jgi:uncharacterized protein with GYD domain
MPTYIVLGKYTSQGITNIKNGPQRTAQARQAIEAGGGKMRAFYLTLGQYDFINISEAPDDETLATILLGLASGGNISTETLRAFTEDEYQQIVDAMP